jgi:hypothetical protein
MIEDNSTTDGDLCCPFDGIVEKWWRKSISTDSRKCFVKAGDRVVTIASTTPSTGDVNPQSIITQQHTVTAKISGNLEYIMHEGGDVVRKGLILGRIKRCEHPVTFHSMCVSCGDKIIASDDSLSRMNSPSLHPRSANISAIAGSSSSVSSSSSSSPRELSSMLSSGRQFRVTQEEALRLQEIKVSGLRAAKKLALVLDLDHTLIHATEVKKISPEIDKRRNTTTIGIEETPGVGKRFYSIKLRPGTEKFLSHANKICQLSIYTAGIVITVT